MNCRRTRTSATRNRRRSKIVATIDVAVKLLGLIDVTSSEGIILNCRLTRTSTTRNRRRSEIVETIYVAVRLLGLIDDTASEGIILTCRRTRTSATRHSEFFVGTAGGHGDAAMVASRFLCVCAIERSLRLEVQIFSAHLFAQRRNGSMV